MADIDAAGQVRRRKLRGRWVALIVLLVLLGGAAGGLYAMRKTLEDPSVGHVVSTLPPATEQAKIELQQYDAKTFSFDMPMTYIEQQVKSQQLPNQVESHTFVSSGIVSRVLTATVTNLPSGKFEDDPSYLMRTQNPAKYKMKAIVLKNETVVIFRSNDSQQYQQTAYWVHAGKLLTLNMSGVANDIPAMTQEFDDMVHSTSWR